MRAASLHVVAEYIHGHPLQFYAHERSITETCVALSCERDTETRVGSFKV